VLSGRIRWTGHGPIWPSLCRPGECRWSLFCRCHRKCDGRETRRVGGSARVEVIRSKKGVARVRAVVGSGTRRSYVAFFRIARSGAPRQGLRFCVFGSAWGGSAPSEGLAGSGPSEDGPGSGPWGSAPPGGRCSCVGTLGGCAGVWTLAVRAGVWALFLIFGVWTPFWIGSCTLGSWTGVATLGGLTGAGGGEVARPSS
jgi:hypothetical protein